MLSLFFALLLFPVRAPRHGPYVSVLRPQVLVLDVKHWIEEGAVVEQPQSVLETPAPELVVLTVDLHAFKVEGCGPGVREPVLDLEKLRRVVLLTTARV